MFLMESKRLKVNIRKIQIMIFLPEQSRADRIEEKDK